MNLIDSHLHLSYFTEDLFEVLERAQKACVTTLINICTSVEELESGFLLEKSYPWIKNVASITPQDVVEDPYPFEFFSSHASKLVAIGETGLDYHYDLPKTLQKFWFSSYLALAIEKDLPVVIHCREAFKDLIAILKKEYLASLKRGVLHCFTGTLEEAKALLDLGFYLSFSGIITFKKNEALREIVAYAPLTSILIETDAPYLAPQSKRGKRNEPSYLPEIADMIAVVKKMPSIECARVLTNNAKTLFSLQD